MLSNIRKVVDEIMDGPDVDPTEHAKALAGLGRINTISYAARQMASPIIQAARQQNLNQITLLDVACGGGDVSTRIINLAKAAGIHIELTLLDRSSTALKLASDHAGRAGVKAKTVQADLLNDSIDERFDVITCSLFLHHIRQPTQVIDVLQKMRSIARQQVVVSDLRRCRRGVAAAWMGSRIMSRSRIVHFDAPASVRAAWTIEELTDFATAAGMKTARVQPIWPWRMLLTSESIGDRP